MTRCGDLSGVMIRFDGVLAKPLELRLLDDRSAMTALMRYDNAPNRPLGVDLAFRLTWMFLSELLRRLLADRDGQPICF
jgi:hypothetical protein